MVPHCQFCSSLSPEWSLVLLFQSSSHPPPFSFHPTDFPSQSILPVSESVSKRSVTLHSSEEVNFPNMFCDYCREAFQSPVNYLSLRMMSLFLFLVFSHRLLFIIGLFCLILWGSKIYPETSHLWLPVALRTALSSFECWLGLRVRSTGNSWRCTLLPAQFKQAAISCLCWNMRGCSVPLTL